MRTLIRFSVRRPGLVIALWLVTLALATPFALRLHHALGGSTGSVEGSPSDLVAKDVDRAFGTGASYVFPVVLSSPTIATDDARFVAAVGRLEAALGAAGMPGVRHFWNSGDPALRGADGRSALLLVTPPATSFFDAEGMVERVRTAAADPRDTAAFDVDVTGMIAMFHDLDANAAEDLLRAERIGIPLTLLVLLLVFGAPVAAALPLLIALGATTLTLALLYALSHAMPVGVFAQNAVTMIGLGIGVDYALFLVSRCRDALAHGEPLDCAVETSTLDVVHVVVVSGLAVCAGFLALLLVRIEFLHSLALGGVAVVIVAIAMTLTLLPALLMRTGRWLSWPARLSRPSRRADAGWTRWAHEAMSRPWRYLVPAVAVLALLIAPTLRLEAWNVGAHDLAPGMEARRGFDRLERDFAAGWMGPVTLLVEADRAGGLAAPAAQAAIGTLAARWQADPRIEVVRVLPAPDATSALILLVPRAAPESDEVTSLVRELRATDFSIAGAAGMRTRVGGFTAAVLDFDAELFGSLRRVVPLVLGVTFLVLVLAFRSIVVPLKAIVMNLLSVLAAYGFLVLVFQDGVGAELIGLDPPGGLNSFIVLMLFTILFGLSMDYEVFLLSRIREEWLRTGDDREAVARGLARTGGLITSAALIMVVLFASFGFTRLTATREFGLGLAFAVALDATLIRVVLVPILMGLMGRANWWYPRLRPAGRGAETPAMTPHPAMQPAQKSVDARAGRGL